MTRRRRQLLPRSCSPRAAAWVLLFAWLAGFAAPWFHRHEDHAAVDPLLVAALDRSAHGVAGADPACADHGHGHAHVRPACSGAARELPDRPAVAAECPDGNGCRDPFHHHHSHEPVGDVVGCVKCATWALRAVLPQVGVALPPLPESRYLAPGPRPPPPGERSVFAWARGPPARAASSHLRDRTPLTAFLRA